MKIRKTLPAFFIMTFFVQNSSFGQNNTIITKNVKLELVKNKAEFSYEELLLQNCLDQAFIDSIRYSANSSPFGYYNDQKINYKLSLFRNTDQIEYKRILEVKKLLQVNFFPDSRGIITTENKYKFLVANNDIELQKTFATDINYRHLSFASKSKREELNKKIEKFLSSEACSGQFLSYMISKVDEILSPLKNISNNNSQYLAFNLTMLKINSIEQRNNSFVINLDYTIQIE